MRLLLLSYAFPPMHVQMTPASLKPMSSIVGRGAKVDVVTIERFPAVLPRSDDLVSYAEGIFSKKVLADGGRELISPILKMGAYTRLPDLMSVFNGKAASTLLDMDLSVYDAVITFSPFHSINHVMLEVKRQRPRVKWIAQFSDPWANNPLEGHRWLTKHWNSHFEAQMVGVADAIIHSSAYSMKLMARGSGENRQKKFDVIGHCFDPTLYPSVKRDPNKKLLIRHVGTLFGRRTPEPLFKATRSLLERRPDLKDSFGLELVGPIEQEMLTSDAAKSLRPAVLSVSAGVGYLTSLKYMAEADLLVLIEADVASNLFLPSKLADYVGSGTPIVGLTPRGASLDFVRSLRCWHASPSDIEGISTAIEQAIDHVRSNGRDSWCSQEFRRSISGVAIANDYMRVIERVIN